MFFSNKRKANRYTTSNLTGHVTKQDKVRFAVKILDVSEGGVGMITETAVTKDEFLLVSIYGILVETVVMYSNPIQNGYRVGCMVCRGDTEGLMNLCSQLAKEGAAIAE